RVGFGPGGLAAMHLVHQGIEHAHGIAGGGQFLAHMTTDEAASACNQYRFQGASAATPVDPAGQCASFCKVPPGCCASVARVLLVAEPACAGRVGQAKDRPEAGRSRTDAKMSGATSTTDHESIRQWAEERGGRPARAKATENGGGTSRFNNFVER